MTDTATPHRPGEGRGGSYRPDIDGLRAVAVSAVVLFHYGLAGLPGGFVGVDVFFVISGYLITGITRGEIARGRFSLAGFYERRVRRIVPAFLVVLFATALASPFVFLPEDLRLLGKSTEASALFGSNVLFARLAADYFDADNLTLQPLLHTWSLAVEAQFYLLYPLLLLPLSRRPRLAAAALAILAAASLARGSWGAVHHPVSAFYLLPGRAWELLAGGLLTFLPARPLRGRAADAAVLLGLAAIGLAAALYTAATPFPGPAALLPCLGAALVLAAGGSGGRVSAVLGFAPLAWLGRVSYSLYLWHWPVIVLARYGWGPDLPPATRLLLLAATVALAGLSHALVERPFIAKAALPRRRDLLLAAAGATTVALASGLVLDLAGRGLLPLGRLPPAAAALAAGHFDRLEGECPVPAAGARPLPYPCRFGAADAEPRIALWGNSYARMWVPALGADAEARGVAGVAMIFSKCPPLLGLDRPSLHGCARFDRDALAYLSSHPAIRAVVLGSDWFAQSPADLARLDPTLAALDALRAERGLRVFLLLAPPQADYPVPRTLALAALHGAAPPPLLTLEEARRRQSASTAPVEAAAARHGATVIDPAARLCAGGTCPVARDGRALFYDAGHITVFAAEGIRGMFSPVVTAAAAPPPEPSR